VVDHGVKPRWSISWAVVDGRPHPAHCRDPDTMGDAAICWVKGIRPPQPEKIDADGTTFFCDFFRSMLLDNYVAITNKFTHDTTHIFVLAPSYGFWHCLVVVVIFVSFHCI